MNKRDAKIEALSIAEVVLFDASNSDVFYDQFQNDNDVKKVRDAFDIVIDEIRRRLERLRTEAE